MSNPVSDNSTLQQEKALPNPFEISKDRLLEEIYMTHFHCAEKYDVRSLHNVASNVINHSIEISDFIVKRGFTYFKEDPTSFQRFPTLKRIACQMICTAPGERYAHQTTKLILAQLKAYSWDAKAVIVQAAFALEYGKFWHLPLSPRDRLGNSLAELNGLQSIPENKQPLFQFTALVKKAMQMVEYITEWKSIATAGYDIKEVPALSDTLQEIPIVVYWAIVTFVTCTSHVDSIGDKDYKYELSEFDRKLVEILENFKNHLDKCNMQRVAIDEYTRRKIIITQTGKDIVRVLKALLIPTDSKSIVYNGLTGEQVRIEQFKKKHVLMFISSFKNINEDIQLLNFIYEKLKEGPNQVKGYRKEDFKILWVPIVDEWSNEHKKILEGTKVKCYLVKQFNFPIGITLIREIFNFEDNTIIPVISSEGKIINFDAKQIISTWGIEGFPFRPSDHTQLIQQWDWLWTEMINLNPGIKDLIEEDSYIFIYGGTDSKWFKEFTDAVDKLKNTSTRQEIKYYPFGKDKPEIVPRFWIRIESLLASKKQKKGDEGVLDTAATHIKTLIFLKQDPKGWVILSKGSNVKLMGQGEAMYRTVVDFVNRKEEENGNRGVSFDVAFKEHYESMVKEVPHICAYKEYDNYPSGILPKPPCPIKCGRDMEVASVNYKCCHGHQTR